MWAGKKYTRADFLCHRAGAAAAAGRVPGAAADGGRPVAERRQRRVRALLGRGAPRRQLHGVRAAAAAGLTRRTAGGRLGAGPRQPRAAASRVRVLAQDHAGRGRRGGVLHHPQHRLATGAAT